MTRRARTGVVGRRPATPGSGPPGPGRPTAAPEPAGPDRGQSTVELALGLPAVVLVVLAVVQVGVIVHHQVLVTHVAREAARAAAVSGGRLADGAVPGLRHGLDQGPLRITASPPDGDGLVSVTVRYRDPTDVALIGPLVPDVELRSTVVMQAEG